MAAGSRASWEDIRAECCREGAVDEQRKHFRAAAAGMHGLRTREDRPEVAGFSAPVICDPEPLEFGSTNVSLVI